IYLLIECFNSFLYYVFIHLFFLCSFLCLFLCMHLLNFFICFKLTFFFSFFLRSFLASISLKSLGPYTSISGQKKKRGKKTFLLDRDLPPCLGG
ncbi:hypothetical protein LEMLEM_LOCUS20231, partial [Lemmus lemmus]